VLEFVNRKVRVTVFLPPHVFEFVQCAGYKKEITLEASQGWDHEAIIKTRG